jgi:hypothetical protein
MRHIWSLVAGVIIAPLAWFLIAFGQAAMTEKVTLSSSEPDFLFGGLLLIGVGLILGLVGSVRTSPVGALIAAVLYIGTTVYILLYPSAASDLFGDTKLVGNYEVVLSTPLHSGVLAVVGGMLLVAVFSPARWRGDAAAADPNAWSPPPPAPAWTPPTVSTPTSDTSLDRSS